MAASVYLSISGETVEDVLGVLREYAATVTPDPVGAAYVDANPLVEPDPGHPDEDDLDDLDGGVPIVDDDGEVD